jgi:iron(III) transport system ATP-binding protein
MRRSQAMACVAILGAATFAPGCTRETVARLPVVEVSTWAMPPAGASVPAPRCVTRGLRGEMLALDTIGRVIVFDEDGRVTRSWMMPDTKAGRPEAVRVLRDGRIAVADTHYHRIVFFSQDGNLLETFGVHGTGPGEFIYPVAIAEDPEGHIYIAEYGSNDRVQKFTTDGTFRLSFGTFGTGQGQLQRPSGIVWHDGRLYVADAINNRIQVFSQDGEWLTVLGNEIAAGLRFPYDIDVSSDGRLFIVEYGAGRITVLDLSGRLVGRYGRTGDAIGEFATPWSISVNRDMRIRIADTGNRRIVELRL